MPWQKVAQGQEVGPQIDNKTSSYRLGEYTIKTDNINARLELDENGFWCVSIHLKGYPDGHDSAKTLKTVRKRTRRLLGIIWDDTERAERAIIKEEIVVSEYADGARRKALEARAAAEIAQADARSSLVEAVSGLLKSGMGMRDAGSLLGLSQARVAQLTKVRL